MEEGSLATVVILLDLWEYRAVRIMVVFCVLPSGGYRYSTGTNENQTTRTGTRSSPSRSGRTKTSCPRLRLWSSHLFPFVPRNSFQSFDAGPFIISSFIIGSVV
jgi:hypothetical protein